MNILITNDDGFESKGIAVLTKMMKKYGNVAVIAPFSAQSGMSMAVSLGAEKIAFKEIESSTFVGEDGLEHTERWAYLDATPASCVKFAMSTPWLGWKPDVIVSGINHGANTSVASCYSGTLGATAEAAVNHILGIGVSLCDHNPDADFSQIEKYFPGIFEKLVELPRHSYMTYYNVNFPSVPADEIKGVRAGYMGRGRWVKEFRTLDEAEAIAASLNGAPTGDPSEKPAEKMYKLVGNFSSDTDNSSDADHLLTDNGYVSIVPHTIDSTDYEQLKILSEVAF
ncbi:MAG: 5'/3'-nucleotidase SurE [Candidatus Cryptobacteroides sp.]|nr:5'/3'-nucleotidase SurE [Bacteroidales bacterium]MDY2774223.1 5'/3'-nucleotidase SurE [Candidatus Cryptobacteroides sp.]